MCSLTFGHDSRPFSLQRRSPLSQFWTASLQKRCPCCPHVSDFFYPTMQVEHYLIMCCRNRPHLYSSDSKVVIAGFWAATFEQFHRCHSSRCSRVYQQQGTCVDPSSDNFSNSAFFITRAGRIIFLNSPRSECGSPNIYFRHLICKNMCSPRRNLLFLVRARRGL